MMEDTNHILLGNTFPPVEIHVAWVMPVKTKANYASL